MSKLGALVTLLSPNSLPKHFDKIKRSLEINLHKLVLRDDDISYSVDSIMSELRILNCRNHVNEHCTLCYHREEVG